MLTFQRLPLEAVQWDRLDAFPDRTVYQTRPWLTFVARTQGAEPVVAALCEDGETVGYFTGLLARKCGLRVLGSPFPGWTTSYMGFNLLPGVSRARACEALLEFAFRELRCVHLELMERRLGPEVGAALGLSHREATGYEIDLSQSEDALFAAMEGSCRRCVRKAEREGVIVEEARDTGFAAEYYAQLQEVFARQGLVPTYSLPRVQALVEELLPTGMLLLLRARDPEGRCIATGIFPAFNDSMYFWGGASCRAFQQFRPNEAIQWHAMRYWKARGICRYDMGGAGDYKQKYGGEPICVPWFRKSRTPLIAGLRETARHAAKVSQRLSGLRVRAADAPDPGAVRREQWVS